MRFLQRKGGEIQTSYIQSPDNLRREMEDVLRENGIPVGEAKKVSRAIRFAACVSGRIDEFVDMLVGMSFKMIITWILGAVAAYYGIINLDAIAERLGL
ncbi:hypothetical protein [uncultured Paraglaciecola sp.]|uniref:hypothetical protein n=1 Tax=uncultured Paraglaciecola sp. TaxID=1765024 RepID=UPI00261A24C9|nr:hypothetical protein [uncultured Paraglaciecola sp.]